MPPVYLLSSLAMGQLIQNLGDIFDLYANSNEMSFTVRSADRLWKTNSCWRRSKSGTLNWRKSSQRTDWSILSSWIRKLKPSTWAGTWPRSNLRTIWRVLPTHSPPSTCNGTRVYIWLFSGESEEETLRNISRFVVSIPLMPASALHPFSRVWFTCHVRCHVCCIFNRISLIWCYF